MSSKSTTKVVYLDQKDWIDIARIYYGEPSEQKRKLVEKILEASEKGQVIFPLSISHLDETMRSARAIPHSTFIISRCITPQTEDRIVL